MPDSTLKLSQARGDRSLELRVAGAALFVRDQPGREERRIPLHWVYEHPVSATVRNDRMLTIALGLVIFSAIAGIMFWFSEEAPSDREAAVLCLAMFGVAALVFLVVHLLRYRERIWLYDRYDGDLIVSLDAAQPSRKAVQQFLDDLLTRAKRLSDDIERHMLNQNVGAQTLRELRELADLYRRPHRGLLVLFFIPFAFFVVAAFGLVLAEAVAPLGRENWPKFLKVGAGLLVFGVPWLTLYLRSRKERMLIYLLSGRRSFVGGSRKPLVWLRSNKPSPDVVRDFRSAIRQASNAWSLRVAALREVRKSPGDTTTLRGFARLYDEGLLTQAEFAAIKRHVLSIGQDGVVKQASHRGQLN